MSSGQPSDMRRLLRRPLNGVQTGFGARPWLGTLPPGPGVSGVDLDDELGTPRMVQNPVVSRGEQLLWTVPAVIAIQQLIVAVPGDNVSADAAAGPLIVLVALALTWGAAARRSVAAWTGLFAYAVLMVVLPAMITAGEDFAGSAYLMLGLVAVGLLAWPTALAHVWSRA